MGSSSGSATGDRADLPASISLLVTENLDFLKRPSNARRGDSVCRALELSDIDLVGPVITCCHRHFYTGFIVQPNCRRANGAFSALARTRPENPCPPGWRRRPQRRGADQVFSGLETH